MCSEPNPCFAFCKVIRELGRTKTRRGKTSGIIYPFERQSPEFCLVWRHLDWDPALRERADGDVEGIKPSSSKEETHPLREIRDGIVPTTRLVIMVQKQYLGSYYGLCCWPHKSTRIPRTAEGLTCCSRHYTA